MTTHGSSPCITGGFADHQNFPRVLSLARSRISVAAWLKRSPILRSAAPAHVYPEDGAKEHEYQGDPTSCCIVNSSTPTRTTWMITETPTSTRMFRSTLWYLR